MSKEEVRSYLARRAPIRFVQMMPEAQWAFGLATSSDFCAPPDWVRKLIREIFGATEKPPKMGKEDFLRALAQLTGAGAAWAQGARLLLIDAESQDEKCSKEEKEFNAAMGKVFQPAIENFEMSFEKMPSELYKGNADTFEAYTGAQAEIAKEIAAQARGESSDSLTDDVQHFLWLFWLEANTATSVRGLFNWMEGLGLVHCSEKLLEKICRQIGFRASKRGRKKRIPTN